MTRKKPPPVEPRPRDYAAASEYITTACGRTVERTKIETRSHLYRLWEPVLAGSRYAIERMTDAGPLGLAHSRRPPDDRPRTFDEQIGHQLREQRRAMDLLRATVRELSARDSNGKPLGITAAIYESRGDILLFSDPEACAGLVVAARRSGA